MKHLIAFLLIAFAFTACKKETDIEPAPLADRFAGTYKLSSFRYVDDTQKLEFPTLPMTANGTTISGKVTLTKKSDKTLDMTFLLTATGMDDESVTFEGVEVRQVGSEYGLFAEGSRIADVDGSSIIFNYTESNPKLEMAFVARK
ncbi:hypothetical protein F5984_10060 [Rudanella paleaurantiibacter]|uniref:Lipocalin-like domain-containing protein n=1 Tax=Rudanella paleaurantiibacter TaxID=2614655 RepID=A0A7J5U0H4_9BACT|nr:hypothetical protein [Rudanella paleaurantiibacter]KAB7731145.1 hypothetical protein F5984_10060 [Rudanella paleaurantiibacter]